MSTSIGLKIKKIREAQGLSRPKFAELTGVLADSIKQYETGRVKNISLEKLEKFTQHPDLKKYSLWLITGETAPAAGQISPGGELVPSKPPEHINLPFYEVTASAGVGLLVEVEQQTKVISFEPSWLQKEVGVNPNDVFLMLVDGDSMYPTLKDGSMIMVNRNYNNLSDGVYVMRHDNNLLVKRLQMLPGGIIKVKSDNTQYDPWEINKSQIDGTDLELIGRVVWTGQRM